jgi:hypothetical protein
MKEFRLPQTPITNETFVKQGWKQINVNHSYEDETTMQQNNENLNSYYWMIPIPKHRTDEYSPYLVSNASDDTKILKEVGLKPGQFFVEMLDMDGLGFCKTEEELEVLYMALTGENINDTFV